MTPRFHCPSVLREGDVIALPDGAARHVQVLRLQPGTPITLFTGEGGEWEAQVERMGRSDVQVRVGAHRAVERESTHAVHLAVGMPANERMDWLVEKATELGVASIQPLVTERTVLRLAGERAAKKQAHWQAIAVAACEQCGRNRVPTVHPATDFARWAAVADAPAQRLVLSLAPGAQALGALLPAGDAVVALLGPEGGLTAQEEALAASSGFAPVSLGTRVLRAETAAIALVAQLAA